VQRHYIEMSQRPQRASHIQWVVKQNNALGKIAMTSNIFSELRLNPHSHIIHIG
jgi:hypothetical protein